MTNSITTARNAACVALCCALGACSGQRLNTGAVDYRAAVLTDSGPQQRFEARYFPPAAMASIKVLNAGDSLAIRLMQGFVCDFSEQNRRERWKFLLKESYAATACNDGGDAYADTLGEIAIVADVVELDGETVIEHGTGTSAADKGRLIYYSEDVRETGQYLNVSNIPLYGPVSYAGRPVYVRLFVLELDNEENAQFTSTLSALANFGGTAYPPASPILGLLNSLGSAFLSGNQDDLEFEYELTLDGAGGQAGSYAPLAVGTYAFVRSEDRDEPIDWARFTLNATTGRLEVDGKEYRSGTYFTLKITRNEPAFAQDAGQLFEQFRQAASQNRDEPNLAALEPLAADLNDRFARKQAVDEARAALGTLQSTEANPVRTAQAWETIARRICEGLNASGEDASAVLADSDVEYLAAAMHDVLSETPVAAQELTLSALGATCAEQDPERALLRKLGM